MHGTTVAARMRYSEDRSEICEILCNLWIIPAEALLISYVRLLLPDLALPGDPLLALVFYLRQSAFICGSFVFSFASLRGLSRRRLGGGGSIRGFSSRWHLSAVRVHLVLSDTLE